MMSDLRGAELSEDGMYRYSLWRRWDAGRARVTWIMLNPSTADAEIDDPTIRRCIGFAKAWGAGGIRVVNLYPFRATHPADLWEAAAPIGYGNLNAIERAVDAPHGVTIAAWGTHGKDAQVREVRTLFYEMGIPLYALKLTKEGAPGHPLYVAADTVPIVYEPSRHPLQRGQPWQAPSLKYPEAAHV